MTEARPRVWVSQPLFDDLIERLHEHFDVLTTPEVTQYTPDEVTAALQGVDGALITLNEGVGPTQIADAARLRAIANVGVGYNNLDVPALDAAGIIATNTPDVLTETTADFGFALMMATARRITESERWLRDGHWQQWSFQSMLGADLHGSTLGILGMGRIGQGIARRASGFNMKVLYHTAAACRKRSNARCVRHTPASMGCSSKPTIWCWCCRTRRKAITSSMRAHCCR